MKRDMDLIRKIMLRLEEADVAGPIEGYEDEQISYHVELLKDANLLEYVRYFPKGGGVAVTGLRLTWHGHEFLDSARSDTTWNKAKEMVLSKTGALSFDLVKEALLELGRQLLK